MTRRLHPSGLQQRPRSLFLPSESAEFQTTSILPENWNSADSPGRENDRGRCWRPLRWRHAVVGAVRRRTEGRPHFKGCANIEKVEEREHSVRPSPNATNRSPVAKLRPSDFSQQSPNFLRLPDSGHQLAVAKLSPTVTLISSNFADVIGISPDPRRNLIGHSLAVLLGISKLYS
ncbi:hypothetical protein ACLB2K_002105 [Fragaria x ananassa]